MIFAIKPFEIHDGDGIRTTVFFKGCPLRCKWCHNPESLSPKPQLLFNAELCISCGRCAELCEANVMRDGKHVHLRESCTLCKKCVSVCPAGAFEMVGRKSSVEEIADEVLKDELFMKGSGGGVTFSGGEPLCQAELCAELGKILKSHGINIAIDSCGYVPRESIDKILPYADSFLFDLKAVDDGVHRYCTGVSNERILENIRYVDSQGKPIELRYPFVPTMNDGEAEKVAEFAATLKNLTLVRVLPYHDYAQSKYSALGLSYPLPDVIPPTKEQTDEVVARMRAVGGIKVERY